MIPRECKRLAEVDFPIAAVSAHSAREKSIRHGHPSTLHLWWARRPLAACRAMLMALLLPDPCDANCPVEFKEESRRLLALMPGGAAVAPPANQGSVAADFSPAPERARLKAGATEDAALRKALLSFIADFANWDNSAKPVYLECARGLVRAAHGKDPPLVVDPFAGGGSIPLEALRLGCEAFASDLNPVACLILKVLLEDIPRHGPALAEELRRVGKQIKEEAEKELAEFYPADPDGARPIAYLWARTVRCEAVGCGAEIPLMRSFWLCKKANRRRALRLKIIKPSGTGFQPVTTFQAVNPWKSPRLSIRGRNLPHLEEPSATYFVTFRCQRGLSLSEHARDLAMSAIRHWDGQRIDLDAAVIMPDHAHAIFRIMDGSTLSQILHSVKSFSSNEINKLLSRSGPFWLDESFDHIIRNGNEWEEKTEYIRQNPVKKRLADEAAAYRWLYSKGQEETHRLEACATPKVEFEIFEPKSESEVRGGTVTRGNAACPCCNTVLPVARVRAQLSAQRGGADVVFEEKKSGTGILPVRAGGARLLAVVTLDENKSGRQYRLPNQRDYEAVWKAHQRLREILEDWKVAQASSLRDTGKMPVPLCPVPDEPLPPQGTLGFRVQLYGMLQWGDIFTARQKLALWKIATLAASKASKLPAMALAIGKLADLANVICPWEAIAECPRNVLSNGRLKPAWDFAEGSPTSESSASFAVCVENLAAGVESVGGVDRIGQTQCAIAQSSPLPVASAGVFFTDPPYYDAIPYADLSDFFYIWLRRALPNHQLFKDSFESGNPLTPKLPEIVQDEVKRTVDGRPKDKAYFEQSMQQAFAEGFNVLQSEGIGCVVFAHKTTEGWEALISGMLKGGWAVTGSWPITTEMAHRLRARESAALAASVHLVCRPRSESAGVGGWEDILRELPNRIGDWMERLSGEGIRGADLVFSCIGPALELFSKYERVETAEGREVKLDEFLAKVWEVVGRTALQQVLGVAQASSLRDTGRDASATLEEDARLTALFLWTLQSTEGKVKGQKSKLESANEEDEEEESDEEEDGKGKAKKGYVLIYDVARRFAQPLGIHMENWEGRIIETKKGIVRLIPVLERAEQLSGGAGTQAMAMAIERSGGRDAQFTLFPDSPSPSSPSPSGRGKRRGRVRGAGLEEAHRAVPAPPGQQAGGRQEATTLDRVHAAMLLQAGGQAGALRALLEAETQRSPDFLRLANALSALYPKDSEEKRLLDAMLLTVRMR